MKKKIFSAGIYREGLRQLRMFGFIVLSLYLVILIAAPILEYADYIRYDTYSAHEFYPNAIGFEELLGPLMALPIFVAPIMTLIIFSGFNKRQYSDFYHALPYTRLCIFLSYTAAILTWVFGILIVSGTVSLVMRLIFPALYVLSFVGWADILLSLIVMILMVVAAISLGCSFTGTLFSNITVSSLILFLPRLIITLVTSTISTKLPFIVESHFMAVLSSKYNILVHYLGRWIISSENTSLQDNLWCDLYSLLLALIMGTLAAVLFIRRKSETASKSAPRRSIQAGIRIALTLALSFTATCTLLTGEDNSIAILLYILAILVYFIYELLSTLKWKNLVRIIPTLGIVVFLNLCLVGVVSGITYISAAFRPAAQDITSVRFVNTEDFPWYISNWFDGNSIYAECAAQSISIKDPEIIASVAETLQNNMESFDKGNYRRLYLEGYSYDNDNETPAYAYIERIVAIQTGSITRYRRIIFPYASMESIVQQLAGLPDYREAYLTLPPALSGTESTQLGGQGISAGTKDWNWDAILTCLQDEINEAGFEAWYKVLNSDLWSDIDDWAGTILSYTAENKDLTKVTIPITRSLTPKTFDLLMQEQYQNSSKAIDEAIRLLKNEIDIYYGNIHVGFCYTDDAGKLIEETVYTTDIMHMEIISDQYVLDLMQELGTQLENTDGTPKSDAYVSIYYNYYTDAENDPYPNSNFLYFPLPEDFNAAGWNKLVADYENYTSYYKD